MTFQDFLDACKAEAILNTLERNEITVWRSICRSYSKKFSTPLHEVLNMDPYDVMIAEFEDQLDDFDQDKDIEALLEQIYKLEDPDYESQKAEELETFIAMAEAEEEKRVEEGRPIHKSLKGETTLVPKELPKSGGINLSYLEDEENPFKSQE